MFSGGIERDQWHDMGSRSFVKVIRDALRELLPFILFKKRENIHGGVVLLVRWKA